MKNKCIITNHDLVNTRFYHGIKAVSRIKDVCCECLCRVHPGDSYRKILIEHRGRVRVYRMCLDCASVADIICCNYHIGGLWQGVKRHLLTVPSSEHMMALTKAARDMICDIFDQRWNQGCDLNTCRIGR